MEFLVVGDNKDGRENDNNNNTDTHENNHSIVALDQGDKTEILINKVFQILSVLFKMIKLEHDC